MALQTQSQVLRASTGLNGGAAARKEADAFMNISIVDKNGVAHSIGGGVALYLDKVLHAAIIAKVERGEELTIVANVNIVDKNKTFDL